MRRLIEWNETTMQPEAPSEAPSSSSDGPVFPATVVQGVDRDDPPVVEWRKEFEFAGVVDLVPEYREQVMECVNQYCRDKEKRIDLLVAVQEALANAALHGCRDDASKRIRCVVTANAAEITITVRDPGPGFPPGSADPANCRATTRPHGRGICVMRSLVNEVSFAHNGAEIMLRKRIGDDAG